MAEFIVVLTAAMRSTSLRLLRMKQASASSILQQRDMLTNNRTKSKCEKNKGKFLKYKTAVKKTTDPAAKESANQKSSEINFDQTEEITATSFYSIFNLTLRAYST